MLVGINCHFGSRFTPLSFDKDCFLLLAFVILVGVLIAHFLGEDCVSCLFILSFVQHFGSTLTIYLI